MRPAKIHVAHVGHRYELQRDGQPISEAKAFLDALALRGVSPCTLRAYAYDLLLLYRWLDATSRQLLQLAPTDLIGFVASQREVGAAPRSINRRLSVTARS